MATAKQIAANRANAKKSTGPRTPEGKARSSLNAMLHGLRTKRPVLPNEDRRQFEAFARAMRRDLRPRGTLQALLAEEVIQAAWRMRRAGSAQADVVRHALARYGENGPAVTAGRLLADAINGDPRAMPFWTLDRYSEQLQRSFFIALGRLHRAAQPERGSATSLVSEANFEAPEWGRTCGASAIGRSVYAPAAGNASGHPFPPVRQTNPIPRPHGPPGGAR